MVELKHGFDIHFSLIVLYINPAFVLTLCDGGGDFIAFLTLWLLFVVEGHTLIFCCLYGFDLDIPVSIEFIPHLFIFISSENCVSLGLSFNFPSSIFMLTMHDILSCNFFYNELFQIKGHLEDFMFYVMRVRPFVRLIICHASG